MSIIQSFFYFFFIFYYFDSAQSDNTICPPFKYARVRVSEENPFMVNGRTAVYAGGLVREISTGGIKTSPRYWPVTMNRAEDGQKNYRTILS